ncbi:Integral inner nuclear membrane protein ima1 [Psilocybe cubensis]|uniref:Ima1 N-terminal domain-containing protein n=2 Tax=Psilocybe cubensis TaxID=181762 RepID=A0A8H8CPI0_PSICU|nr:Integral inner nuclear membrane protein ima1 [Psilocybe cubensis]KAH9486593.1 Integral inner nuclear membrane protein ima1 [Psilocybe cubensis]
MSDEPAMHNERLNSRSFAKRASPSKDRLPTNYGPGPFCHSCQTNQMLLINLLSNYLPDEESTEYQSRLEMLPAYRESLHARYPPVCDACLPQVEEEIHKKEQMARAKALAGWLSKGKDRKRRVSGPEPLQEKKISDELFWWRVRGYLWATTLCISLISTLSIYRYYPFKLFSFLQPILPLVACISILWTAWDPTYATLRKSQTQGRDVRVHGKREYIALQVFVWCIRLCSSILLSVRWFRPDLSILHLEAYSSQIYFTLTFTLELSTVALSYYLLRIQQPPSIRLIDTHAHTYDTSRSATPNPGSRGTTPTNSKFQSSIELDTLQTLSLSSKPVLPPSKPIFGMPSLQGPLSMPQTPARREKTLNEDDMDWTPTHPETVGRITSSEKSNNDWLRPQRFFAPENPTGLEGLLETTRIQEDEPMPFQGTTRIGNDQKPSQGWLYITCSAVVVVSIAYTLKWSGLIHWAF